MPSAIKSGLLFIAILRVSSTDVGTISATVSSGSINQLDTYYNNGANSGLRTYVYILSDIPANGKINISISGYSTLRVEYVIKIR